MKLSFKFLIVVTFFLIINFRMLSLETIRLCTCKTLGNLTEFTRIIRRNFTFVCGWTLFATTVIFLVQEPHLQQIGYLLFGISVLENFEHFFILKILKLFLCSEDEIKRDENI